MAAQDKKTNAALENFFGRLFCFAAVGRSVHCYTMCNTSSSCAFTPKQNCKLQRSDAVRGSFWSLSERSELSLRCSLFHSVCRLLLGSKRKHGYLLEANGNSHVTFRWLCNLCLYKSRMFSCSTGGARKMLFH